MYINTKKRKRDDELHLQQNNNQQQQQKQQQKEIRKLEKRIHQLQQEVAYYKKLIEPTDFSSNYIS